MSFDYQMDRLFNDVTCGHCGQRETFEHVVACRNGGKRRTQLDQRVELIDSLLEKLDRLSPKERVPVRVEFTASLDNVPVEKLIDALNGVVVQIGGVLGGVMVDWWDNDFGELRARWNMP